MGKMGVAALAICLGTATAASAGSLDAYMQTNLTSDLAGVAPNQDPNLVNPWGIVAGPKTPFWVSDNGTGLSTLYNGSGTPLSLVVTIAGVSGQTADPDGIVFNSNKSAFGGSPFIFSTESGTIAGWVPPGTTAPIDATGAAGSIYKGLATTNNLLYAANFGLKRIDVYDSGFKPTSVSGNFVDASLPSDYAPFNITAIGNLLYVTFAKNTGSKDEAHGPGLGYVDAFDVNGNFVKRIGTQGVLNAPWGLALAPSNFGAFSNDLLVGNFGDGTINAFDPSSGTMVGTLKDIHGNPISNQGLWGLSFGNGSAGTSLDTLYFTAGIPGTGAVEDHGLFGAISIATPEPSGLPLTLIGLCSALCFVVAARRKRA
jgi:uncharacterized protein (TIGR03118 family)